LNIIDLFTESDTLDKTRRSLVAASVSFLLIAALEFRSNEVNVFGLKLGISQDRILLIGQIVVGYLLFRYVLQTLMKTLEYAESQIEYRNEIWSKDTLASFPDGGEYPEYDGPEPETYEEEYFREKSFRETRLAAISNGRKKISVFSGVLVNFALPILIGAAYLCSPSALDNLLTFLQN